MEVLNDKQDVVKFVLRIPKDLDNSLNALSDFTRESKASIIRHAIRDYLDRMKPTGDKT